MLKLLNWVLAPLGFVVLRTQRFVATPTDAAFGYGAGGGGGGVELMRDGKLKDSRGEFTITPQTMRVFIKPGGGCGRPA